MYNPRYNSPFGMGGERNSWLGPYPYQTIPYVNERAGSLVSKVMLLLAISFLVACIGTFVGISFFSQVAGLGAYLLVALGGLVVLFILQLAIEVHGLNLFLLYLFTFLEGMSLAPLVMALTGAGMGNILGEAFLITALSSLGLAAYAWTTKRDFSGLGKYLFFGLILLLVAGIIGIFLPGLFGTGVGGLLISIVGIAIFGGYVLYYVQRAKYLADTLPNAIMLTVAIFVTVMNLFLYILRLLMILQGGNRDNR
uniref:BAX inhibitor protein n=1 Tax=Thermogemmatispora argillosa TaxID=2045280 RepID=A0A455T796_9CHLR|nr:BAX inhibitor protein [Thermogemmatispora argillosa]